MQPIFETRRLIVRPRTEADTELCFAMDSDPEVTRFVTGPWSDQQEHRAFIEARTRGPYPEGMGYWAVCLRKQPDRFIGWVLLIPIDAVGPEVEIGWRMRRDAWGRRVRHRGSTGCPHACLQAARLDGGRGRP